MRNYPQIGIQVADVLLPAPHVDLKKWAVIACDQFTSEPEYWEQVRQIVTDAPSTFHITLPEVFLGTPEEAARTQTAQKTMQQYLDGGVLQSHEGFVYVERTTSGKTRHGLVLALDLEKYDYNKGSQSLIRATEGTILDRLPPRMKIRQGARVELPHILVLIDDPQRTVIEPLAGHKAGLKPLYDTDLMLGSGHLSGYLVNDPALETQIVHALEKLAAPESFQAKYNVGGEQGVLLFAMGDGNHSLATAKAIWEKIKAEVGMDHPARYALVEIENVHDEGLEFEPIHRVLFGVKEDVMPALQRFFGEGNVSYTPCQDLHEMVASVDRQQGAGQSVGLIAGQTTGVVHIHTPSSNLPVGTLQAFLDAWLKQGGAEKIDYVHGEEATARLGAQPGNLGFYLPGMSKSDLFKTVILDGALPRKTFSMGEARDKRFYMECRRIA